VPSCRAPAGFLEPRKTRLGRQIYAQCWKFYTRLVLVYLYWFRHISLLKCVSQPLHNLQKYIKPLFWCTRSSKVIALGVNRKPVYTTSYWWIIVTYALSRAVSETATYWLKIANFSYFLLFSVLAQRTHFEFMEQLYGSWASSRQPTVKIWWSYLAPFLTDPHVRGMDGRTNGQNCDG